MNDLINFIALDFETANSFRGSICEIGLAVIEKGKMIKSRSWLIQPKNNVYDHFNTYIHGINPQMTKASPTFKEVWPEVQELIQNQIVVSHNTAFDMYSLADALNDSGIGLPIFDYFCSLRLSREVFPGLISYSLPSLCKELNIEFNTHHRAEADAIGCAEIFLRILSELQIDNIDYLQEKLHFKKGRFDGNQHCPQRKKDAYKIKYKGNSLKELKVDEAKFDESNYFYGKEVCFTGSFSFGVRRDLLQAIANIGGSPSNSVTKTTNVLVVGQQDYRIVGADGMSSKQKKAISLIEKGQDLEIMSESEFLSNFGVVIVGSQKN